jgi:hypothetical protein
MKLRYTAKNGGRKLKVFYTDGGRSFLQPFSIVWPLGCEKKPKWKEGGGRKEDKWRKKRRQTEMPSTLAQQSNLIKIADPPAAASKCTHPS